MKRRQLIALGAGLVGVAAVVTVSLSRAHAAGTNPAPLDAQTLAAGKWLNVNLGFNPAWRPVTGAAGTRYQAYLAGVGLVEVDAATDEVDEVIYDSQLQSGAGKAVVPTGQATSTAAAFAQQHFAGFDSLTQQSATLLDHGSFREIRIQWQQRDGEAWLPTELAVGVNAATGHVAYFWSERVPVTINTVPAVTAAQALAAAGQTAPGLAVVSGPDLEVHVQGVQQHLVWVTRLAKQYTSGVHVPDNRVVWTDAQTGASREVARS
jgi:hypothetical protein